LSPLFAAAADYLAKRKAIAEPFDRPEVVLQGVAARDFDARSNRGLSFACRTTPLSGSVGSKCKWDVPTALESPGSRHHRRATQVAML
jgi:hypothetical protein